MDKTRKKIIKLGIMIIFLFVFLIFDKIDAKAEEWIVPTDYSNYGDTSRWPYDSKYATNTASTLNYHDRKIYLQLYNCTWNKSGYNNYVYYWIKDSNGNLYYTYPYFKRSDVLANTNTVWNGVTTLHKHYMPEIQIAGAAPSIPTGYVFTRDGYNYYLNLTASAASTSTYYYDYYSSKDGTTVSYIPEVGVSQVAEDYLVGFRFEIDTNPTGTSVGSSSPFQGVSSRSSSLDINVSDYFKSGITYYIHVRAESYTGLLGAQADIPISNDSLKKNLTVTGDNGIQSTIGSGSYYPGVRNIPISAKVKAGYQFLYWTHESGGTVSFINSGALATNIIQMPDSDTKAKANSRPNRLTIYFNANGGYNVPATQTWNYDSWYGLPSTIPKRAGNYKFENWALSPTWSDSATRWGTGGWYPAQSWASAFGKDLAAGDQSVTLYAQWSKEVTHTFNYFNGTSATASVTFHNGDTSQPMEIPSVARGTNKTYNGSSDWAFRGFSKSSAYNSSIVIGSGTTKLTVKNTDSDTTYYAQYQRNVKITYIDYGDDAKKTSTASKTAYLNYNGTSVYSPTFTSPTQNTMKYTENGVNGQGKKETWTSRGWTTSTTQNASVGLKQNSNFQSNKDVIYYGLYEKDVTLTYEANGGTVSPSYVSYTRYANAVDVSKATKKTYTMPTPEWKENGVTKYSFGAWTYEVFSPNEDFYNKIVINCANDGNGNFKYTPLVNDTVYAAWTNEPSIDPNDPDNPIPTTDYEPKVSVTKEAVWNNPAGDNSAVDFDNLQDIDIDGIAKVTIKVNITNQNNIGAKSIKVTDYFNTDMWEYYQDSTNKPNVSTGSFIKSGNTITWTIPDNTTGTVKLTYYVKIKETYWDVDDDTNEYINKIPDLNKYLASLIDSSKNPGTANVNDFYYCSSIDASKAYVWVDYKINAGKLVGTSRQIHNATPYVVMRQVNWIPLNYRLGIESDTNNIYRDLSSDYENTYFVKYDTKSSDSSNSTFRLYELSQIRRSYSYYQITDNLMDMRTIAKNQEVIDNYLALNDYRGSLWSNVTDNKLSLGFNAKTLIPVVSADNIRSGVTTNGLIYKTAALTSYDTVYATNQDGLKISVYPFIRTTNSKTGITYETTRDTNELKNKRIDLVIDATDPIITPPDSGDDSMLTEDEDGNKWEESDGYMDINLVDNATNPSPATKTLTFNFEDEISGINSPDATNSDWIDTSSQNVQITLERVDNDPIMIFDSGLIPSNQSDVVKVTYDSTSTMNKTGNIKIVLDPNNDDILGHLRLTIKVIDNVSNYTVKTYDIYVFCLTGSVEISDTLPDYLERQLSLNQFANGELGYVKVSAGGYVDRVTLDFDEYLDKLYKDEYSKRQNFIADVVKTINGDYPNTDAASLGAESGIDPSMTYLPYEWQVRTWGYTDDTLGGLRITKVKLDKYVQNVNNSILQEHLSDLIERYQGMAQGETYAVESGSDYAIVGSTLYTYSVMDGDSVTSYVHKYELGGETYYDDVLYPAYVTLDGTKGITIAYESAVPDEDDESEEVVLRRKIVASVEDETEISISNWVQDGEAYLRPFMHYFYMPLEAKQKTASDPYYVTLTSYKDSEKEFKHSVTIRLSFYNDLDPIHRKLETYIKDN